MGTEFEQWSQALSNAVAQAAPGVVRVEARRRRPSSGILLNADGLIVTSAHAVERDENLRVSFDGDATVDAELIGRDPGTDVALLRAATPPSHAAPSWTDTDDVAVGRVLLAVARPGRTARAAFGIISALSDHWRNPAGARLERYLEADLSLSPGFSGGAVIDAGGRFVGMATSGLVPGAAMIVPARNLREITETLQAHGGIRRGYIGIGSHPVRLNGTAKERAQSDAGLLIFTVEPGGPSDRAGLLLGDVLLDLDSRPTRNLEELFAVLGDDLVNKTVTAKLLRAGEVKTLPLTIGERR